MKSFFSILIIAAVPVISVFGQNFVQSQSVCRNQTIEKISSRGISLEMSLETIFEALAEDGKLSLASVSYSDKTGNSVTAVEAELKPTIIRLQERARQNFDFSSVAVVPKDKTRFDGISRYYFGFLDNRLAFFSVYYLKPKWENLEQFAAEMSELLNLPIQEKPLNFEVHVAKCGVYAVEFRRNYRDASDYSMTVTKNVDQILTERRKKHQDEQK